MKPFALARWRFTNCCRHSWGHPTTPHTSEGAPDGGSRRDFLKTAAAGVAGLAAFGSLPAKTAAQVRVFPPPPPAVSPIEGLIDFHNHCAPDAFGRAVDDDEMAQLYKARGVEAVVLKNHVALTADRAWLVRKHNPGIKAFGGVTLNGAAGGLNPEAVQWMWRMQGGYGRVVWLPTFDADNHVKHFKDAPEGIKVVGADGKALPALREIAKICAQHKLVLCTGHASPTEVLAIVDAARDAGCDRIVATHAEFDVVNMTTEQMKKAGDGRPDGDRCDGAAHGPAGPPPLDAPLAPGHVQGIGEPHQGGRRAAFHSGHGPRADGQPVATRRLRDARRRPSGRGHHARPDQDHGARGAGQAPDGLSEARSRGWR